MGAAQSTTAAAGPTATAPTYADGNYFNTVLTHHNLHRANHSAPALTAWNDPHGATYTLASRCTFAHNTSIGGGGYGQNLAAGLPATSIGEIITGQFYNGEEPYYPLPYGVEPSFANFEKWGHFSQVVWKGTTSVRCVTVDCSRQGGIKGAEGVPPYLTVCNYYPAGNYVGEFGQNVGKPLGKPSITGRA